MPRQKVLLGWIDEKQFFSYLGGCEEQVRARAGELAVMWRRARQKRARLESREGGIAETIGVRELGVAAVPVVSRVMKEPAVKNSFGASQISFKLVEIDKLCALPLPIYLDFVESTLQGWREKELDERGLLDICFPENKPVPPIYENRLGKGKYEFHSDSEDFRIVSTVIRTVEGNSDDIINRLAPGVPVKVLSIVLGYGLPHATAIRVGKRLLLNNGFHRLYALRKAGVARAPMLIVEEPEKIESMQKLPFESIESSNRPPLFKDYFDAELSLEAEAKHNTNVIEIAIGASAYKSDAEKTFAKGIFGGAAPTSYAQLISAVVAKQGEIMGLEMALKAARKNGLQVEDDGSVANGSRQKLELLVGAYKELQGGMAVLFAKKAIKPLLTGKEDLPQELR